MARVALDLQFPDQPVEGQVLVRQGLERTLARLLQQVRERRIAAQVAAQYQGVDEEAHQPFDLRVVTARGRHADQDVGRA